MGRQLKEVITASEPPSWLWLGSVGGFCLETAVSEGSLASGTVPDPTNSSLAPVLEVLGAVLPDPTGSGSLGCFPGVPAGTSRGPVYLGKGGISDLC